MAPLAVSALPQPYAPPARCGGSSLLQRTSRPASCRCFRVDTLRRLRLRLSGYPVRRLDIFTLKCFAPNIDIDCDNIVAEDPVEEIVDPGSIPVIHLKPDILDSNPIDLLSKGVGANHPHKMFDILSKAEQDALAATPTHPAGLYALYAISLVGNLVEQLWSFVWPAAVATVHPNLLLVAVVGFCTKLAIFVGGPLVGKFMDYFPRVPAYHSLNFVQTAAQLISAGMIIFALNTLNQSSSSSVLLQPWFLVLVMTGSIERLAGLALGVTMERDWVVLLAGRNRPVALAQANSVLGRVDLLCEIAGASLFGILLSKYNPVTCLKFASCLTVCVQPVLFILGQVINSLSNGVLDHSRYPCVEPAGATPLFDAQKIVENGFEAFRHGWREYKHQPVLPASLAYVLLYFNIALAPGAIMTSFLVHHGIRPSIIGGFSGLCSIMGVAATFISTSLIKRLGILKAGAAGLVFQAILLALAVCVYWTGAITEQARLLSFLFFIVVSRLGHMSYDVVGTQILQTGIPVTKANLIGITEVSMASLAELLMFGVAIIANDVSHFGVLASLSVSSVVVAALIFCQWLANPTELQRKLFQFATPF